MQNLHLYLLPYPTCEKTHWARFLIFHWNTLSWIFSDPLVPSSCSSFFLLISGEVMKFSTGHHHCSYVLLLGFVLVNGVAMGSEGKIDEFSAVIVWQRCILMHHTVDRRIEFCTTFMSETTIFKFCIVMVLTLNLLVLYSVKKMRHR